MLHRLESVCSGSSKRSRPLSLCPCHRKCPVAPTRCTALSLSSIHGIPTPPVFLPSTFAPHPQASSQAHPKWQQLCDPTSSDFALEPLILSDDNTTVLSGNLEAAWATRQKALWRRLIEGASSPACEMLGLPQRRWLKETLDGSRSPLRVVASGSVLVGAIGHPEANGTSNCDGDDWACWTRAQVNFLHTVANASGCVVVITGDYHLSDIKVGTLVA